MLLLPLSGSCNPGGKVSVDELAEGIEPGQNRRHNVVHLGRILQVRPQDPLAGLVERDVNRAVMGNVIAVLAENLDRKSVV